MSMMGWLNHPWNHYMCLCFMAYYNVFKIMEGAFRVKMFQPQKSKKLVILENFFLHIVISYIPPFYKKPKVQHCVCFPALMSIHLTSISAMNCSFSEKPTDYLSLILKCLEISQMCRLEWSLLNNRKYKMYVFCSLY